MTFDDSDNSQLTLRLEFSARSSSSNLNVAMTTETARGSVLTKIEAEVPRRSLEDLADWIEALWDRSPDFKLPELGLVFSYSHREHVGEIYYEIFLQGRHLRTVYEQGGLSNTKRASELRYELSKA